MRPYVTTAPTKQFAPTAAHARLHALCGAWRGVAKTHFDASSAPADNALDAVVEDLMGGRHARITYATMVKGALHVGEMTLSFDEGRYTIAWLDSFHTGTGVVHLVGDGEALTVAGGGWRIALTSPSADELVIDVSSATTSFLVRLRRSGLGESGASRLR